MIPWTDTMPGAPPKNASLLPPSDGHAVVPLFQLELIKSQSPEPPFHVKLPTVRPNDMSAASRPPLTVKVMSDTPARLGKGVMLIERFAPLPPMTILFVGTSAGFEDAT